MSKKWLSMAVCFALVLGLAATGLAANKSPKGQIIFGTMGDIETLNPLLSEANSETNMLNGIFSQLVRIDDQGNFVPDLVTEVPTVQNGGISKDGLTYTFHLNRNAKWHDGQPVTSEDVKFTWELIMNEKVQVVTRDGFDNIVSIDTPDKYTVVMHLKKIIGGWLLNWAQTSGDIVPQHILGQVKPEEITKGQDFSRHPIGSGPFKFIEYKENQYVILEANKDYFGKGPYLAKVIFKLGLTSNNAIAALQTGEVDVWQPQSAQYDQVVKIDRLQVRKDPASIYAHITPDLRKPYFQDKRVRQAMNYLIPRQQIVDNVLKGIGVPAAATISPVLWAYNKDVKPYPYDPAKAAKLLDEAGWKLGQDGIREKDGVKFSVTISTNQENATRVQIEQILKEYWKAVGIELEIKNYDSATLFGDVLENIKFDLILFAWVTPADPDEYPLYHSTQIPTKENGQAGQNYAGFKSAEIDKLLDAGRASDDRKVRLPLYQKEQQLVHDEAPIWPIYYYVNVNVAPKNLVNFRPAPFTNAMTWNINEWQLK